MGSETDGSVVCPSSANGLVGIKPTLGLISRSGIIPIAHSQDTAGPMTRTVADAAILLGCLAGPDAEDPATIHPLAGQSVLDYTTFLDAAALRGARRQADYLIDRARAAFPGASAEQNVKAMNFLLPHIRRMPEKLARDQFAADAAQKLGIDSAVLREELRQAALRRRDHIETKAITLTEVERVLLRALAIDDPAFERSRRLASDALAAQPAWFEHLAVFAALQALSTRQAKDPMDVVEDEAQRALLAETLLAETGPPEESEVQSAIQETHERAIERRQRELRSLIAEAERRGDQAELALLTQQKLDLDRALRQLHNQKPPEL